LTAKLRGVDEPLTGTEKRRISLNLLIRFGAVGFSTWWLLSHVARVPAWGWVLYAVADLGLLVGPIALFGAWLHERRAGPGG
jgi:hypothetical protein